MASKAFTPLISGKFLTFFMWFFIVIALASAIWYVTYVNSSKNRNPKTTFSAIAVTAVSFALAMTLITVKYDFYFK